MGAFRFLHRWTALVQPDDELADAVPLLEDRDRELEDYLEQNVTVLDVTNALSGTAPVFGAGGFMLQAGTNVDSNGSPFTVTFDTPFPNGVVSVVACFGDSPGVSDFYVDNVGTTGFRFTSSAAVGHRVNWIALGW